MVILCMAIFAVLVVVGVGQVRFAWRYTHVVRSYQDPIVSDEQLPRAAIILCLRGADPFLEECLERLADQDYPHYTMRLVIDGRRDAAVPYVQKWIKRHPELRVDVAYLETPFETCTLYCSSIYQAIRGLHPSIEAVAFANADTMPHRGWLRSLMAPLVEENTGAVTGNRWYVPKFGQIGSLIRFIQNASMIQVMHLLGLLWGGSLALKRDVFEHPKFLQQLQISCCEDHAVRTVLDATGLQVAFAPSVLMVNTEECSIASGFCFLRRQSVWTRLYHRGWSTVMRTATLLSAMILIAASVLGFALVSRQWESVAWILGGVAVAMMVNGFVLWMMQRTIAARVARDQGEPMPRLPLEAMPKMLLALPLSLYVFLAATFSADWLQKVTWRGITYEVVDSNRIRLVAYRNYQQQQVLQRGIMSL